jgi:hypothetical protein
MVFEVGGLGELRGREIVNQTFSEMVHDLLVC